MGVTSIDDFKEIQNQANEIQFFFKINGKTTAMRLNKTATVLELKNKIEKMSKVPASSFHCVVGKTPLSNNSVLIDTMISKDSTVICNLKLKGGAFIPGQIVLQKDASKAQEKVVSNLMDLIEKWKIEDHNLAVNIIKKANEESLMYSEDSLGFYLNEANKLEKNKELDKLFGEVNKMAGGLIEVDKKIKEGRYNSNKHKEIKEEMIKSIKNIIDRIPSYKNEMEENDSKICEDLKNILDSCINGVDDKRVSIGAFLNQAFMALKGCPYYTLDTPELILLKSRDIPLQEVYMNKVGFIDEFTVSEDDKTGRKLFKCFYKQVYSDTNALSKQIKSIGFCNNYYLRVLKEQHKERDSAEIKKIIDSLVETIETYDQNSPFSNYDRLNDLKAEDYGESKILETLKGFNENGLADNEDFAAVLVQVIKSIVEVGTDSSSFMGKNMSYWVEKKDVLKGGVDAVNDLREELKNRVDFARGLFVEFTEGDGSSSEGISSFSGTVYIDKLKTEHAVLYEDFYNEMYTNILNLLLGWTDNTYVVNLKTFPKEAERLIKKELDVFFENNKYINFDIKMGHLCKIYDRPLDDFISYRSGLEAESLKKKFNAAANKGIFGKTQEYTPYIIKGEKSVLAVGTVHLNAQVGFVKKSYEAHLKAVEAKMKLLGVTKTNLSLINSWVGSNLKTQDLKPKSTYQRIMDANWYGADLLEEANYYYIISDKLRDATICYEKFIECIDMEEKAEKQLETLHNVKHIMVLGNTVFTNIIDIGIAMGAEAATGVFYKQISKLSTYVGGLIIDRISNSKAEALNLSSFILEMNRFVKVMIEFQKSIKTHLELIFDYRAARFALKEKA